jgi:hypothetical protein
MQQETSLSIATKSNLRGLGFKQSNVNRSVADGLGTGMKKTEKLELRVATQSH